MAPHVVSNPGGGWWLGTFVFAVVLAALLFGIKRVQFPGDLQLKYTLVSTAVFCCWLMWGILYMAQMNPLVKPILAAE